MDKLILITLLIKLGVAAAIASALVRSRDYQNLLFTEERSLRQTRVPRSIHVPAVRAWRGGATPPLLTFWPPT